jgi:hypothetical protein
LIGGTEIDIGIMRIGRTLVRISDTHSFQGGLIPRVRRDCGFFAMKVLLRNSGNNSGKHELIVKLHRIEFILRRIYSIWCSF